MKRIALALTLVLASSFMAAPAALAGHHGYHGNYRGYNRGYYGYRGGYARPYVAAYPVLPAYGAGPYYPAPVYPYGPAAGVGVSTPNFSFWYGQ
jgi:hypothetical protein